MLLTLACGGPGGRGGPRGDPGMIPGSPAWRARSTPIAVEYLRTLPDDRIGSPVSGIALADGARWLEGHVYRGRVAVPHPGMHVSVFESPEGERTSLAWIDAGSEAWPLPECGPEQGGVRARTLAGQVYTWRALRPGDGIVSLGCPPPDWPDPGSIDDPGPIRDRGPTP